MKILVTGGAGFIGSNFILYWLKNNPHDEIVNLDKLTYAGNLENLKEVENLSSYKFIRADIADKKAVWNIFEKEKPQAVINFAAESHVDRSILGPDVFVKTNILGTQNLLDAALQFGKIRFHQVSTDEVFGSLDFSDPPFSEKTPYDPRSPYSASKAGADFLVRAYHHTFNLPTTISNCSNNYGPFMHPEKFIPLAITNLLEDKKVPLYGDGKNVRDWLFVEDHVRAIELILKKGKIGESYCIGGDCEKENRKVLEEILRKLGKTEEMIEFVKDRPGHDRRYAIDFSKIKKELGWQPRYSFEEGLERTIHWYQNNQQWWKRVKSGEYLKYYQENYQNR